MRLVSLNLNKRLGRPSVHRQVQEWLAKNHVELFVAQEPWHSRQVNSVHLNGYRYIGGNHLVGAWMRYDIRPPICLQQDYYWQVLHVGYLAVDHVYLDPYATKTRSKQLRRLESSIRDAPCQPRVVIGDFNIAPRTVDGIFDGRMSRFNTLTDRAPFHMLCSGNGLIDLTAADPPEYSVERVRRERTVQFRCDLALASDYLAPTIRASYDHTTRNGSCPFTDHSALVVDLPLASEPNQTPVFIPRDMDPRNLGDRPSEPQQPANGSHKTAMARRGPSPVARAVVDRLVRRLPIESVLDYGCGRGVDVLYYRQLGLRADGYDPHPSFGWVTEPPGNYDLITVIFVLNVVADPATRLDILGHVAALVSAEGFVLLVTRSRRAIERQAAKSRWRKHNDGYW